MVKIAARATQETKGGHPREVAMRGAFAAEVTLEWTSARASPVAFQRVFLAEGREIPLGLKPSEPQGGYVGDEDREASEYAKLGPCRLWTPTLNEMTTMEVCDRKFSRYILGVEEWSH